MNWNNCFILQSISQNHILLLHIFLKKRRHKNKRSLDWFHKRLSRSVFLSLIVRLHILVAEVGWATLQNGDYVQFNCIKYNKRDKPLFCYIENPWQTKIVDWWQKTVPDCLLELNCHFIGNGKAWFSPKEEKHPWFYNITGYMNCKHTTTIPILYWNGGI